MKRLRSEERLKKETEPVRLLDELWNFEIFSLVRKSGDVITQFRLRLTCKKWSVQFQDVKLTWLSDLIDNVVKHGHLDVYMYACTKSWLRLQMSLRRHQLIRIAIEHGRLHLLKCPNFIIRFEDETPMLCAVEFNRLEVATWLKSKGCPLTLNVALQAAANGRVEFIQWIYRVKRRLLIDRDDVCIAAAFSGQLKVLKTLYKLNVCYFSSRAGRAAAAEGQIEVLKWAFRKGLHLDHRMMLEAITWCQLETAQWLRSNGCSGDERALIEAQALSESHPEILEWVESQKFHDSILPKQPNILY